ncbi:MAG TPA: MlaD family protein [Luteibaculaceae bacterium]|nr:MlaD family protein [Luteibaculaceae bacterium]
MSIRREVKIGFIFLAGLTVFLFGLNYLKGNSLITARRNYFAIYSKVDGLKESNPINVNGFKVGQVAKIELLDDQSGKLRITLAFTDRNLKITKGSIARIVSSDLLGSKAVEFVPGKGEELAEGSILDSEIQQSLTEVIGEQIDPVKAKFIQLMTRLDSVLGGVNHVLNDQTVGDINQSFGDIRSTIQSLEHATAQLDKLLTEQRSNLGSTIQNMNTVTGSLASSSKSIESMITNLDSISAGIRRSNVEQTMAKARETMASTAEIVKSINSGEGSMGLLVKSDSLHRQLVSTTKELQNLFEDIQQHPKRYVGISVFGRKEKGLQLTTDEERRLRELLKQGKR